MSLANIAEMRLSYFFKAFVEMYLDNKGWFRLAWHEYIDGDRPQGDIETTEATNRMLNLPITMRFLKLFMSNWMVQKKTTPKA